RSEEELRVGTATREKGRVRLRKWVETEEVTRTVPVTREEVRIEREPITESNVDRATDGPAISEEEHEMTLYEDEVVATKQAVPKERVRLGKDVRVEEETVAADLRKERIAAEGDVRR
ncbi:MAG: YsnF/AvaK domain-containing protein, partial [Actinomycetes bacterium]